MSLITLKSFLRALLIGALSFWLVLIGHQFLGNLARAGNHIAAVLYSLPAVPVAVMLSLSLFFFFLIKSGLFRLILVTGLLVMGFVSVQMNPQYWSGLFGELQQRVLLDISQYIQKDTPIYSQADQLAEEPIAIYYVDDGNPETGVNPALLEELNYFVSILPDELLEQAAALYYVEDQAFEMSSYDGPSSQVFGFSNSGTMSSSIRLMTDINYLEYTQLKSGAYAFLDDPAFYKETIIHELSHLMDMKAGSSSTTYSDTEEFQALYQADPYSISGYGASNASEFFAEAAVYYYMYPELLETKNPDVFNYFEALYHHYY